ncbi:MAG: PAS domain S-box protein [Leptospirales bacterium]|nr:PAS domain S-box protein [Leptospirales bacterium]
MVNQPGDDSPEPEDRASIEEGKRLRMAIQSMPVMVDAFDENGLITVWNSECERVTGFTAAEVVGNPNALFMMYPDQEYREKMLNEWAIRGDNYRYWAWEITCKDGSHRFIEWSNISEIMPIPGWARWGIGQDVTERYRLEAERESLIAELQTKNAELERRRQQLEQFMYAVSHDLMSPLVTIQSFAGFIGEHLQRQDFGKVEGDLGYIQRAGQKMQTLLDELLELSRLGRPSAVNENCGIDSLIAEALDIAAGRIASNRITISLQVEPLQVYGDRRRLVEVFQNLIDNACKYIGKQTAPEIRIHSERIGNEVLITVADNGIGIDPRYADKPFQMFEKLDPESEGAGMGLTIVQRIVQIHEGKIWFESPGVGAGTSFFVQLPLSSH